MKLLRCKARAKKGMTARNLKAYPFLSIVKSPDIQEEHRISWREESALPYFLLNLLGLKEIIGPLIEKESFHAI